MIRHFYQSISGQTSYIELYTQMAFSIAGGGVIAEFRPQSGRGLAYLAVELANAGKTDVELWGITEAIDRVQAQLTPGTGATPINLTDDLDPNGFADASIDFLMMTVGVSVAELQSWLPKVKSGGRIAGAGYHYPAVASVVSTVLDTFDVHQTFVKEAGLHALYWSKTLEA